MALKYLRIARWPPAAAPLAEEGKGTKDRGRRKEGEREGEREGKEWKGKEWQA